MKDFKIDFSQIEKEMRQHQNELNYEPIRFQVRNAEEEFVRHITYYLSLENKKFIWQNEYEGVIKWLEDNHGKGLYLYGSCGRGKSLIATKVIPSILIQYPYRKVVKSYNPQQMNLSVNDLLMNRIFCLDDIGIEDIYTQYGNRRHVFTELIDSAEKMVKVVIVTSNLDKTGIFEKYGERTYERLISTTMRVHFDGDSLRDNF